MPFDDGSMDDATWPLPKYHFQIDFGTKFKGVPFQEVSGLDLPDQVIQYRSSNSSLFSTKKMPGIAKYGNIGLKKGIFANANSFWDWYTQNKANTIEKGTVIIKLLDEVGDIKMQWQLDNAWPTKITHTDLKTHEDEVAVEKIEIAYEQLTVTTL